MAKSKCIGGLTIFAVCCAIYGRSAFLSPTDEEMKDPTTARHVKAFGGRNDPGGLLYGMRKYVLIVGAIGLLIALEDYYIERTKAKKPNKAPGPTTTTVVSRAAQEPRQR